MGLPTAAGRDMTTPPAGFVAVGLRGQIACTVCGHRGHPFGPWMNVHKTHLPARCCGKPLPVYPDGTARVHTRAPIGCQP